VLVFLKTKQKEGGTQKASGNVFEKTRRCATAPIETSERHTHDMCFFREVFGKRELCSEM
jgi:hypothetical protein